jgi:D-glycero-alpha-D-manno-heptose-7-phosphate kinase
MSPLVSTPDIDRIYEAGLKGGAYGGKLLGAGGGGFIMFLVEPGRKAALVEAMGKLLHVPIRFDFLGSQIVYYSKDDDY